MKSFCHTHTSRFFPYPRWKQMRTGHNEHF